MRTIIQFSFLYVWMVSLTASAQNPELVVQTGHTATVRCVAFSHDGKTLASGSFYGTIKLWDLRSGREIRTLKQKSGRATIEALMPNLPIAGQSEGIRSVAFSPDDSVLASAVLEIKLWEVSSGRELRTLSGHTISVNSIAFSPDGQTLASGSNGEVKLWKVATGSERRPMEPMSCEGWINSLAFAPGGQTLAAGSEYGLIRLWDVATGRNLQTLRGLADSLNFSADGRTLASAGDKIEFWSVARGRRVRIQPADISGKQGSVAFSPDGRNLASGAFGKTIKLWDVTSGRGLQTLVGHTGDVGSVAFSHDGRTLASGSEDTTIKLWDVASGRELQTLAAHARVVFSVAFSPDGHILATGCGGPAVKLWDLAGGRELQTLVGHTGDVESLVFSPDGRTLASGSQDTTIKLWDVATGRELRTLAGHFSDVSSVAFSRDGRILASGSLDAKTKLWDVASGQELQTLAQEDIDGVIPSVGAVRSVAFSPDGRTLVSAGHFICLWDLPSGRSLRRFYGGSDENPSVCFSPDGRILASPNSEGTFGGVSLLDVASGQELKTLAGQSGNVTSIAFRPDGRMVASGSIDGRIDLVDLSSGKVLRTLDSHGGSVLSLAFSPDGRLIASGGNNGSVELCDPATGNKLVELIALDQNDWAVVDPAGRFDTNDPDKIRGLSWVFPDEPLRALPPEIFMRDYYEPKILTKVLKQQNLRKVVSLSSLNRTQPGVEVINVGPEAEEGLVSVTVRMTSTRSEVQKDQAGKCLESGAYDLRLFRDGQLVAEWPEQSEPLAKSKAVGGSKVELESWRRLHEIKLTGGEYIHTFPHARLPRRPGVGKVQFTAYCFNSDRVKSLNATPLEYLLPKAPASTPPDIARRAYLLSMGVNANQSRWNLDFAVASAQEAARLLHQKLADEYKVVDISLFSTLAPDGPQVLLNRATKANLKAVLDLLAGRPIDNALRNDVDPDHIIQAATPDDAVVLYISSHGYADSQGTFYVVPYDTGASIGVTEDLLSRCQANPENQNPACQKAKAFLEHTISSQELADWWAGVDAGEMAMILDSCHSAAAPGREFRPGPLGDAGFGQLSYDKGMRILSAAQPDKTARATLLHELGHSLLVEALLRAAEAHPQESVAEWLHDTERLVPVLTHELYPELNDTDVQFPALFDFKPRD